MELGVGPDAVPALDGDEIELVFGPQGGWHVEVGVRLTGLDPEGTVVTYEAYREEDGALLSRMRYAVNPRRLVAEGDASVRRGDLAIFDIASSDEVADRDVTITARLEDESGQVIATDLRTLRVVDREP